MKGSMNIAARLPTALLALLCAAVSLAQEGAAPPRPATPPATSPTPPAPPAEPQRDADAETPPAAAERPEVNDEEFIPTEELQPDAAVTFPVDI
jgi:hypothetical protein